MNSACALTFSPALTSFGTSISTGATKRAFRIASNILLRAGSLFSRRRRSAATITSGLVTFSQPNSGRMLFFFGVSCGCSASGETPFISAIFSLRITMLVSAGLMTIPLTSTPCFSRIPQYWSNVITIVSASGSFFHFRNSSQSVKAGKNFTPSLLETAMREASM